MLSALISLGYGIRIGEGRPHLLGFVILWKNVIVLVPLFVAVWGYIPLVILRLFSR